MANKKININKEEAHHIIMIMKERGVGHCKFCADLLEKLEEKYEKI